MNSKGSSGNKTGIIVAAVGGVLVLLLIAIVFSGGGQIGGSEFGEPTLSGTPLPPMPGTTPFDSTATGLPYPEVNGADFDGNEVSITNDGRAKAIVFLAHWCPHCQVEVPKVQSWINAGGSVEGVDLYSVATATNSGRPNYPPSEWLEQEAWTVPVIVDDSAGSVHTAYGSGGFPYWVFTNSDGSVELRSAGEIEIDQLIQILESLS
jgi:thiol-disulfide isomerase/thioredoxin